MIYQRQFIKELSWTAVGIFVILLVVLVATQAINLLGRAASGRVAIDAVSALIGFWTIGLTPVLLILTAYISIITVLTRYWRDSEMVIWLSSGLSLRNWIIPLMKFAIPFAVLVAIVSMLIQPWAEWRSREFAEILKQKQEMSLLEPGVFKEIGKAIREFISLKHLTLIAVVPVIFLFVKKKKMARKVRFLRKKANLNRMERNVFLLLKTVFATMESLDRLIIKELLLIK